MNPVIEGKLKAAHRFVERLLATPAKDHIAKVILHGSVAEGTARPESDIDLVVFRIGGDDTVPAFCDEVSFDTLMETTEIVEPLTYPLGAYRHPPSYFLYRALHDGREIYSMDEEELKREEIEVLYELGHEYLGGAKDSLRNKHYRIATDAAYNAAELAVKALIFLYADKLPSTHRGVLNRFGELYIKSGRLPLAYSRRLRLGLHYRNLARYEGSASIGPAEAQEVIQVAEELLAALETERESGERNEQ